MRAECREPGAEPDAPTRSYHRQPCSNNASSSSSSTAPTSSTLPPKSLSKPIADAVSALVGCITGGGKVLSCGNGGSARDAQHFAAEFVGRFERERPGLAAISLTTDTSTLTAVGNDYELRGRLRKQVEALGAPGDVLLAMTTSGNSANVLAAVDAAQPRK